MSKAQLWVVRQVLRFMHRTRRIAAKFVVSFVVMTIVCTIGWKKFVGDRLYDCTDAFGLFDYFDTRELGS
jgi:hypothetical protein